MTFTEKDLQEIIADIIINVVDNVSEVTDANVGGIMRQMIESIALELEELYGQLDDVYSGSRIDTATGTDLEQLGKLVGVTRKAGTQALGDVTFVRNTPAGSDFTISSGLIISTQPNTGDEQLRFLTSSSTTFYASISDEEHTFKGGIYDYQLDERFIGNTTSVEITGEISASSVTFVNISDFNIIKSFDDFLVSPTTITTIDSCDATTDWTESDDADAVTTDSSSKKQGTASLNLGKSGTSSVNATWSKLLGTTVSGTSKDLVMWLYFANQTEIDKVDYIKIWLGSGGGITNSYEFKLNGSSLSTGWNLYRLQTGSASTIRNGTPSTSSYNYLRLRILTNNTSDTITLGNAKMDFWHFGTTYAYEGDIVRWSDTGNKPDNSSVFETDYTPLSREVECVAESVGEKYNVNKKKITYHVSNIPSINTISNYVVMSGGTDLEIDSDLKQRILYATELKGKATSEAIRQAILAVDGVASCTIDDMPERSVTSETHLFTSGTTVYKLDNEVLSLDSVTSPTNLIVEGLAGATTVTFLYGTDYTARYDDNGTITSELEWQAGGTSPDNNTLFYVDYTFDWLGHVTAFVSGVENPISASVLSNIEDAVDESRAAGITVTITEPTIVYVNVTCEISPNTAEGYVFTDIQTNVEEAIQNYINELETGVDVYVAELYAVIMGVTGVKNSSISLPASDVTITASQIAKAGVVTVTEI